MAYHCVHRRKRTLSDHEKKIRLLTGLSMLISFLFAAAIFLLVNRQSFFAR